MLKYIFVYLYRKCNVPPTQIEFCLVYSHEGNFDNVNVLINSN